MAANDAFTAGVRPGGLTDSTEIRLLLCYLVKNAGPITRTEIENALMEEQLVNYFEIGSCLDDITRQQLVTLKEDRYSITEKGRRVAQELAYDLPRSVRERAVAAVLRSQTWARKEAEYSAASPKSRTATAPSAAPSKHWMRSLPAEVTFLYRCVKDVAQEKNL